MKRDPIEVFSEWAYLDKDYGMEKNHETRHDHDVHRLCNQFNHWRFGILC